jgi:hypothetical protein
MPSIVRLPELVSASCCKDIASDAAGYMLESTIMKKITQVVVLLALAVTVGAQNAPRPEVPDTLKAPAGEEVVLQAHATGSQIYVCQAGSDQKLAWVLKAPDAELFDAQGKSIGHHSAGPSWKLNDGSEVIGKVVAKHDAPEPDAIPWLLLTVATHSGSGILSRVTSIQRIHTKGGQAPQPNTCEEAKRGTESKIPYSADYYFYAPAH